MPRSPRSGTSKAEGDRRPPRIVRHSAPMGSQYSRASLGEANMRDSWRIGVSAAILPLCAALAAKAGEERRPADAIAEMFANADKPKASAESASTPARPDIDYEMDLLRRARAEAEERNAAGPTKRATLKAETPAKPEALRPEAAQAKSEKQPPPPSVNPAKAGVAAAPAPAPTPNPIAAAPTAMRPLPAGAALTKAPVSRSLALARISPNATVFKIQIRKPDGDRTAAKIADAAKPEAAPPDAETAKPLQALAPTPAAAPAPTPPPAALPTPPPAQMAAPTPATATANTEPARPSSPPVAGRETSGARATVLVVLDDGTTTSPDPILCLGETCAISAGLSAPARMLPRADALALKTTRDATIDPCFGKTACAFRDVPVTADAILQIIFIGSGKTPNPGDGFSVAVDATCKLNAGNVECGHPLETSEFIAWIVPEAIAKQAGAPALEAAIADGLPSSELAQTTDK